MATNRSSWVASVVTNLIRKIRTGRQWLHHHQVFRRIALRMKMTRAFLVDIGSIALIIIAVGILTWKTFLVNETGLEVGLPKSLLDEGYSPEAVAGLLASHVEELEKPLSCAATSNRLQVSVRGGPPTRIHFSPSSLPSHEKFDFSIPGTGFSVEEVARYLRRALGIDSRVVADVIDEGGTKRMFLWSNIHIDGLTNPVTEHELDDLLWRGAVSLEGRTGPLRHATYLCGQKKYPAAIAEIEQVINSGSVRNDEAARGHNLLAIIALDQDHREQAVQEFGDAIRLDPRGADFYYNRGAAWMAEREYSKAIADFKSAIAITPVGSFYANLGNAQRHTGDLADALTSYREAITRGPRDASAYLGRGNVYYYKGDLQAAINDYKKALEYDPVNTLALGNLGNTLDADNQLGEAKKYYTKAIRVDAKDAFAYDGRAEVWIRQGDLSSAASDIENAIRLNPVPPDLYELGVRPGAVKNGILGLQTEERAKKSASGEKERLLLEACDSLREAVSTLSEPGMSDRFDQTLLGFKNAIQRINGFLLPPQHCVSAK